MTTMKNINFFVPFRVMISLSVLACAFVVLQSCGGGSSDPAPSEAQRVTGLMTASPWKIQSVTVDGTNQNSMFPSTNLTFTSTSYTSTGGGLVWPASGTWSFQSGSTTVFVRSDNMPVTIESISATAMTLSLTWSSTTLGGGRTESLQGKHVFTFGK